MYIYDYYCSTSYYCYQYEFTSTRLMLMPYAMTRVARLRMYLDDARYAADSPSERAFFFFLT